MIRRPPRSTLFPSAPLSRSTKGGSADAAERAGRIYREQLEDYEQPPIDDGVREALREYVARRRIELGDEPVADRKSTRLNSSHGYISYAVFCLKKKTQRSVTNLAATIRHHARRKNPAHTRPLLTDISVRPRHPSIPADLPENEIPYSYLHTAPC